MYIDDLSKFIPWFFALDHVHYSRWLPVHVRDMATLYATNPEIEREFRPGKFVVNKSIRKCSGLAIYHALEQNNAVVNQMEGQSV